MKKRFTKILSLALAAIAVMSLSVSSFAANNKPEPLTPTPETTWGDVCRHFEPEWFATLPEEIQKTYNETLWKRKTENHVSTAKIHSENSSVETKGLLDAELYLDIELASTSSSIAYYGGLAVSRNCPNLPEMALTFTLYDDETGAIVDSAHAFETDARECIVDGATFGLESAHIYDAQAIGTAVAPPGYYLIAPVSGSTTIATK